MASLTATRTEWTAARPSVTRTTPGLIRLTAMELRKLIKRPMTWVIFGLPAVLGAAWFPVAYLTARAQGTLSSLGPSLFPPGYISNSFDVFTMFGPICVAVLAAGLIGSEHGWGTIRILVGSGVPRWRLLGGKIVALALAVAAWIATSFAAATLSSVTVTVLSGRPLSFGPVDAAWFASLGLMFARTWLVLAAWLTIAATASVVGKSLAAGIAVPIVWQVIEGILSAVAPLAGSLGTRVSELLILINGRTMQVHNVFGPARVVAGAVSQTHAVLVLGSYVVVMLAIAFAVFIRRDHTTGA